MSYHQRQRETTGSAKTPCRYEYWWRQRQRSDGQRGRSPVRSAPIPSDRPAAVFDPGQSRLIEPPRRTADIEKGFQHSHSDSSLRSSESNASICSNTALLEKASPTQQPLPPKRYHPIIRRLRYNFFAAYQRLFTFTLLLNLAAILILLRLSAWNTSKAFQLTNLATLASSNFLIAILFRQDWLINLLFRTAWLVPWSLPLRLRRIISRVYCYGGIHSGAAVAGTAWWIAFTCVLSWEAVALGQHTPALLILALLITNLLLAIVLLSLPRVRARYHNAWELAHRFLGWLAVALFWAQILLLTPQQGYGAALVQTPSFWNLAAMTAMLVYPWLRLRRWTFTATRLSPHALQLTFPNPVHKYSCLVLSDAPWREWHPFATFPSGEAAGNSLIISDAGDWTKSLIRSVQDTTTPPSISSTTATTQIQFFVKPHPHPGVLSLTLLYPRILILTTGSGIGPTLSSLLDSPASQSTRLIWSTRSPLRTYGPAILELVRKADPQAVVLDTDQVGRVDLVEVAWRVSREMRAEAVFVLSNEGVTRRVVGGLEGRGVVAFGPIWDS